MGRKSIPILALVLGFALALTAPAGAQAQLPYAATAPTKGALYPDGPDDRYLLGGTWLYQADPGDVGLGGGWWRNVAGTAGWSPVAVPNSFNAGDFSSASMNGSVGWYRRDFTVPAGAFPRYVPAKFRNWIIRFESVNYRATVWLNGRQVGTHAGAYLPFEFDLKGVHSGVNRLIVRVDDRRGPGDLPPGPGGGWWNFGGINREVYLRPVGRADMSQVIVRPTLPCPTCAATIHEQVAVRNTTARPQTLVLQGSYGSKSLRFGGHTIAPHATWVAHASATLRSPHLWAPDDPFLYQAHLTLSDSQGRRLQRYFTDSGVRSVTVTGSGQLELNGRPLNLRGVSVHELNISSGAALNQTQLANLVGWAHQLGATVIRAHYPLNPQIAQLADQDGILLWSEVPVYQVASQFLTQTAWLGRAHAILRQNIAENQNHPSVLLWSIGNELPTPPTDTEASYIAGAAAIAHQLDPTRPVGMAIQDWPGVACQGAYAPLDVIGFNDYFGWFDAGGGTTDDRDTLSPFLDSLHACYPNKSLMVTEFGFEGNRNGPIEERGTYQFQANLAQFHLNVFATKPYLAGAIWFALQNFPARPGWTGGNPRGDPPWVEKGQIDQNGNPTPLFGLIQSIYRSTVQIAPMTSAQRRARARSRSKQPAARKRSRARR
ncbi:MAG TPA: glycoside hydrolase family 2 TIM barrel-domain containing protein, partial [Solirubrobacteraceae bacterium]